jgi:LysM repeat protein
MHDLRGLGNALVIALVSMALVAGALTISSIEFTQTESPTATLEVLPSPVPLTATPSLVPSATPDFSLISATPSIIPSFTVTSTPPANCQIPSGWLQITVQAGETLASIAAKYRALPADVQRANCLPTSNVVPGTIIYVPPVPPNTTAACIQGRAGWTKSYTVRAGDNLYRIGYDHYTTLDDMRRVNCRVGDTIYVNELLWVPNVASRTPPPTALPGSTITPSAELTQPYTITVLPYTITPAPATHTIQPITTLPEFTLQSTATSQIQP